MTDENVGGELWQLAVARFWEKQFLTGDVLEPTYVEALVRRVEDMHLFERELQDSDFLMPAVFAAKVLKLSPLDIDSLRQACKYPNMRLTQLHSLLSLLGDDLPDPGGWLRASVDSLKISPIELLYRPNGIEELISYVRGYVLSRSS